MSNSQRSLSEIPAASDVAANEPKELEVVTGQIVPRDAPPVAALAMMENALAITQRMAEVVDGLRRAAIKMTDPVDWVLNKDKQGAEVAMLVASGSQKVASLYGITLEPLEGRRDLEPERTQINGKLGFNLKCRAFSRLLGRSIEIEATRREDEEFTGRETDDRGNLKFKGGHTFEPDLKKSVRTLAVTTAVRELVGLKNVSRRELDDCWQGTKKTTAACRFGHGYGTSQDRTARGVAEEGVGPKAKALWEEILRRTGGDNSAALQVLKEITSYPAGTNKTSGKPYNAFSGVTSWEQITNERTLDSAKRKLDEHPMFGEE